MGQPNEKEDPNFLLDELIIYEENYKNEFEPKKNFVSFRNILEEYLSYKKIIDKIPRKKFSLSPLRKKTESKNTNEIYDKNKLEEINHKFERINKWIKMAKTPHKTNFHFFRKISGKFKEQNSTKNIFSKKEKKEQDIDNNRIRKRTEANKNEYLKKDNSDIIIIKKKLKRTNSFNNSSIIGNNEDKDDEEEKNK